MKALMFFVMHLNRLCLTIIIPGMHALYILNCFNTDMLSFSHPIARIPISFLVQVQHTFSIMKNVRTT